MAQHENPPRRTGPDAPRRKKTPGVIEEIGKGISHLEYGSAVSHSAPTHPLEPPRKHRTRDDEPDEE